MENIKKPKKNIGTIAKVGLVFNILFLLGLPILNFLVIILLFMPPIGVFYFLFPILSITLGFIGTLCHFEKNELLKKEWYLVVNIINFILPIIVIAVVVSLFSTGILVIRFM